MKKLLMLGTSKGSCEMIQYAKSQGIYTVVTDYLSPEESVAKKISDEYWMISTGDIETLVEKCKEEKIDGICSGISTFCIPAVVSLTERLGLQSYCTHDAWHYTMNKWDFKQLCRECNVPVAHDYFVSNPPTNTEIEAIKLPVVVKAVDQSANRGMSYCYNRDEIIPAIKYAHSFSKNSNVIIERLLTGVEYTAYYALANGDASLVSLFSDLSQPNTPSNCYAVNSTACDKLDVYLREVDPFFRELLKKGGMTDGVCWIELIFDTDGHFYVIEMGYRMSGDMMAIPIYDVTGFNSYKWLIDIALGVKHTKNDLPLPQAVLYKKCGCSYILWSTDTEGEVKEIKGLDYILSLPGVHLAPNVIVGSKFNAHQYMLTFTFTRDEVEGVIDVIKSINENISVRDIADNDVLIRFTDFDELRRIYYCK